MGDGQTPFKKLDLEGRKRLGLPWLQVGVGGGQTPFKKLELEGKLLPEPLLTADKSRFVLFPIKHTDVS